MAAAQCAGGHRAQSPGSQGDLLALHRRAPAGDRRAAVEPAGEGSALRAVRAVAARSNPLNAAENLTVFRSTFQMYARVGEARCPAVMRAVRRLTVLAFNGLRGT